MGQHVSHSKGAITTRAILDMCNSLTRNEVLEIAFKLIKDTDASNTAVLWGPLNANTSPIPHTIIMNHLMESKTFFSCECWKCHERSATQLEVGTGVQEVIAYLDYVLDEFAHYFYRTRKVCGADSTLMREREHISSSPLSFSYDDDCTPSSVACNSIDSPPCVEDEFMSDYAMQENSTNQGSVLAPTHTMHGLRKDTENAFRQNSLPISLVDSTPSW